jgi:hypothetical protein
MNVRENENDTDLYDRLTWLSRREICLHNSSPRGRFRERVSAKN